MYAYKPFFYFRDDFYQDIIDRRKTKELLLNNLIDKFWKAGKVER